MRLAVLTIACLIGLTSTAAEASRRKKKPPPREVKQTQEVVQDPFKACDLQLRDQLRDGGTWLTPTEIKIDEARLTLQVTHAFGESGRSVPRQLRGDSEDERRQQLRAHLAELRATVAAVKDTRAWFIIAPKAVVPGTARATQGESTSPWYGLLLADLGGKCRTIAQYPNISVENLPAEVRAEIER